MKNTIN